MPPARNGRDRPRPPRRPSPVRAKEHDEGRPQLADGGEDWLVGAADSADQD